MDQGDVVQADLPQQRPVGHEQHGLRPAIIVHSDTARANLSSLLIVPFSAKSTALRYEGTVRIDPDAGNGLSVVSYALVHQLRAIDVRRINGVIGSLNQGDLDRVMQEVARLLNL